MTPDPAHTSSTGLQKPLEYSLVKAFKSHHRQSQPFAQADTPTFWPWLKVQSFVDHCQKFCLSVLFSNLKSESVLKLFTCPDLQV